MGTVVSKVVAQYGKKLYVNDTGECKVNTADVTPANILKPSCPNPTPNEYANIRNNKNQTLPKKQLGQSVNLQQLLQFGSSNQTANALREYFFYLKMANSRKKFKKQCSSFKSTKDLKI